MKNNSTVIGKVISVSSSSILVSLSPKVSSGLLVLEGKTHRVGQVGSFVRIPQGYNNLFGIISESSESSKMDEFEDLHSDRRIMRIELVGESTGDSFDRGITQYPSVNDEVNLVLEKDLRIVYGNSGDNMITIGKLSSSDSIDINIDLDKLVTRHSAVLGSTGSGKSTSIASLLRSISTNNTEKVVLKSARIILIDIHGEYTAALKDISNVFSIDEIEKNNRISIPFWSVSPDKLIDFLCGPLNETNKNNIFDRIVELKRQSIIENNIEYIDKDKITAYSPIPFSLKKLWYDLIFQDTVNYNDDEKTDPAYRDEDSKGDPEKLIPPKFLPPSPGNKKPVKGGQGILIRPLESMRSRLLDNQYSFFLNPEKCTPDINGKISCDLDIILKGWLGHDKPISILDLSGMPSAQLDMLLGSILDIIFQSALWGRNLDVGMKKRPLLIVLEEAHRYLSSENNGLAKSMVQRIAKEGRKFGIGTMLVSQRPSEIDDTILSQCGTLFALRISNSNDKGKVKSVMSDGLAAVLESLPILRTGEAIIVGEAATLPSRCRFRLPPKHGYPDSIDPEVTKMWRNEYVEEDYSLLIKAWRKTKPIKEEEK
ncbi:ATP-binding protein [Pectobacterium brasiliense]|uniref:ATP-binding protein n=1 Tax=Pectobacterium brasiliense TaxID=180957 RepID=UPI00301AD597